MSSGVVLAGQLRVRVLTALILLAFIACGLCRCTCECDTPQVRAVLIRFFYATGGAEWRNASGWASYDPVCSWYGIVCEGSDLTDIDLYYNRLTGTLPADLANITSIQRVNLDTNRLFGPLPSQWGAMTHLVELNLHMNSLNGTLPAEWGKMSQIRVLRLDWNSLNGTLPPQWGAMQKLEHLELHVNEEMRGSLPPEWGKMSQIRVLYLSGLRINGTLPPEWGAMQKLEQLHLDNTKITGSLPPEWGNMTQIRAIGLYENGLTGPLPAEWSKMAQLETLNLKYNALSGSLAPCLFPRWNASFMSNDNFDFSKNLFSGRLLLPCLSIDPCASEKYRQKMNYLLRDGNQELCNDCFWQCQCSRRVDTAIESPNLAIVRASNSSECCSACVKHPLCVAAVYYYNSRCELKNVTSPTFPMRDAEVLFVP